MKKLKNFVVPVLLGLGVTLGIASSPTIIRAISKIKNSGNSSQEIKQSYNFHDTFDVPDYFFEVGNETVKATSVIIFPDGSATTANSIVLSQYGYYTIRYEASYNGNKLLNEEHFYVYKDLFTYSNFENSFVIQDKVPDFAKQYTNVEGAYLGIAKGDRVTLNAPIDATKFSLSTPILQGFVTPTIAAENDFSGLIFYLTDYLDPSIYLRVYLNSPTNDAWPGVSYWRAGGQNQSPSGYDYGGHRLQTSGMFGTKEQIPFAAYTWTATNVFNVIDPATKPFKFYLNNETMEFYGGNVGGSESLVCDFDNPDFFPKAWDGFPSGKCILSIEGSNYSNFVGKICLQSVLGIDLTQTKIIDNEGPEITVNYNKVTMPEGVTGLPYRIPTATAFDREDGEREVLTSVYYNYTGEKTSVSIKDNKFIPSKNGYYTIVYEAKDTFNNVSTKELWVHVGNELEPISADIPNSLNGEYKVGKHIAIPELVNLTGGDGDYQVKVTAIKDKEKVDIHNYDFQPLKRGVWTIRYDVTDYVNNQFAITRAITVIDNDEPDFDCQKNVLTSYMSGAAYKVPEVYANLYENDAVTKVRCEMILIDDNGTNTISSTAEEFTPFVNTNNSEITLKFVYNDYVIYEQKATTIIPYVNNKLTVANYFRGEGYELTQLNEGALITQTSTSSSWAFHSKLIAQNFNISIANYLDKSDYTSLKLTLTDSADSSKQASIIIDAINHESIVCNKRYTLNFDFLSEGTLNVYYKNNTFLIGYAEYAIPTYDNGEPFEGFSSELVYLSSEMVGNINSSYLIQKINGNGFSTATSDRTEPEYISVGEYGGAFGLGTTYHINRVIYSDVLSPTVTAKLTVTDPNGDDVYATDGTLLRNAEPNAEYDIVLNIFGSYSFSYEFSDKSNLSVRNNVARFVYKVGVADNVPPVIELTSSWTKEAKVGDTIVLPDFKVTDNITPTEEIIVIKSYVNPFGYEKILDAECNSIIATNKGTYVFKISAIDSMGNMSMVRVECVVK